MMCFRLLSTDHALELMQNRRWKVGRLDELNDPADCFPVIKGIPGAGADDNGAAARRYLAPIYANIGMLCFCTDITDTAVWAHYADHHRGIALGFNLQPAKRGLRPFRIKYAERRPVLQYSDLERVRDKGAPDQADWMAKIARQGFNQKARSWAYESEARIYRHLGSSQILMDGRHYFERCSFPDAIVLGLRCKIQREDIIRLAGVYAPSISQAHLDRLRFRMRILPCR